MINSSTVMLLRASLKRIRLQLEAGEEVNDTGAGHLVELANECEDLSTAILAGGMRVWDAGLVETEGEEDDWEPSDDDRRNFEATLP